LDQALWITWYDLPADGRDAHLAWLHNTYMPRLLKKPGFLSAANYACEKLPLQTRLRHTDDASVPTGNSYILVFSAENAHAFAHPTPRKLHAELPKEDQKMLAMRVGERVVIFIDEARADGPDANKRERKNALAPCIQLGSFGAGTVGEDEMMDWYANGRMTAMQKLPGCIGVRKLVSVVGWAKHGVLYEFVSLAERNKHFPTHEKSDPKMEAWTDELVPKLLHAPGSPNVAQRIWPPIK
jgi:hypothetical protein